MDYITKEEKKKHCDEFPCKDCPVSNRCEFFEAVFTEKGNQMTEAKGIE